ncbi:DUF2501 domain-containing protein [Pseudomonas citronellolis]|uniref:DUF2501 domain-containing protein n=1 Tax=Pseudomonas citronellolis TaxID=53408 RepID=UPI0023E4644E|nr:DUF2501 domain-containing protein [Pseudomonas citronellolis]MDF3933877.1 DUF2501 domain-containing protein [Pseudomonas citronellolis]
MHAFPSLGLALLFAVGLGLSPAASAGQATSALGGLTGALPLGSMTSSSTGNVAGLLEFCVKNNYLSAANASSVKSKLMGKLGADATSDSGYEDGSKGVLTTPGGKQVDLSASSLKEKVTKQACDKVLSQGKSML